jgi:GT2 family glycosyltransferase
MAEVITSGAADPPARPLVHTVVLTYNNFADTDECLESLAAQSYAPHRLVLVDNHSSDGSGERLREKWGPRVDFIDVGQNLGVAGGYNVGLRRALADGAAFVVVCNNDITVEPDFVEEMVAVFAADDRIGMAAPLTVYYDRPDSVWFAGIELQPLLGVTRNLYRGRPVATVPRTLRDTDYVVTHAAMISGRAIAAAGEFDERFFYGYDDLDYSLRLRERGFRCVIVGRTTVKHKVSVTSGSRGSGVLGPKSAYTYGLGTVLTGAKHNSGLRAIPFLVGLVVRMSYTLGSMAAAGRWDSAGSYLRGLASGFKGYGLALFTGSEASISPESRT